MPTDAQKERADNLGRYVFLVCFIVGASSPLFLLFTDNVQITARIFVTALWVIFAFSNGVTFYTGRMQWKRGPTFTREESPVMFYASAILFSAASMSIATYILWLAYTEK